MKRFVQWALLGVFALALVAPLAGCSGGTDTGATGGATKTGGSTTTEEKKE